MEKFSDWFDPNNMQHLKAFKHLCDTGVWPEGFIPNTVELGNLWHFVAVSTLAKAWLEHKLDNEFSEI